MPPKNRDKPKANFMLSQGPATPSERPAQSTNGIRPAPVADYDSTMVEQVALVDVLPDPYQSRGGLLPLELMVPVYNGELSAPEAIKIWAENPDQSPLYRSRFDGLRELADSILTYGLINPIHVYHPKGDRKRYRIETGERRFWAHWLLALEHPDQFASIPAIVEEGFSVERQVDENEEVSTLSAVGQARNVARAYLMELQARMPESSSVSPEQVYQFYQQATEPVSDFLESSYRPRQFWQKFEKKLGLTRKSVLDRLDVFKLPMQALMLADAAALNFAQLKEILRAESDETRITLTELAAYHHQAAPALRRLARLSIDSPGAFQHEVAVIRGLATREKRKMGTPLEVQSNRLIQAVKGIERLNDREVSMIAERIRGAHPEAIEEIAANFEKLADALKGQKNKAF